MAVLNEPNNEHCWWRGNATRYFTCYDAITAELKRLDPTINVAAPEMGAVEPFFDAFQSHVQKTDNPPDTLTIHPMWGARGCNGPEALEGIFEGLDTNVAQCRAIAAKARALFPGQRVAAAESGVILEERPCGGWTNSSSPCNEPYGTCPPHPSPLWLGAPVPTAFWSAAASAAVQLWGRLAELDFDFVTIDQFFGGQVPD